LLIYNDYIERKIIVFINYHINDKYFFNIK